MKDRIRRIGISPPAAPRTGWAEAAALVRERGEAGLLDEPVSTRFDESSWEWDDDGSRLRP